MKKIVLFGIIMFSILIISINLYLSFIIKTSGHLKYGEPIHVRCLALKKIFSDGTYRSLEDKHFVFNIDGNVQKTVTSLNDTFTYVRTIEDKKNRIVDVYSVEYNKSRRQRILLLPRLNMDEPVLAELVLFNKDNYYSIKIGCLDPNTSHK